MFPADVAGHEGLAFSFIKKTLLIHFIVLDGKWHVLQYSGISQCDFIIPILKKYDELTRKNKNQRVLWKGRFSISEDLPSSNIHTHPKNHFLFSWHFIWKFWVHTSAFGSPRGPPTYAMGIQLHLNLDLLTQALQFPRHDTTSSHRAEVWVEVSFQAMLSLTACCWPVSWPGPHHSLPCSRRTGLKWIRAPKISALWTYLRKTRTNKTPASLTVTKSKAWKERNKAGCLEK